MECCKCKNESLCSPVCGHCFAAIEAEYDRYKKALEDIAAENGSASSDSAEYMVSVAKEALKRK